MSALLNSIENLDTFRDSWDDDDLLQETLQNPYFTQLTTPQQAFDASFNSDILKLSVIY